MTSDMRVVQPLQFGPYRLMSRRGPLYLHGAHMKKLPPKALGVLWLLAGEAGQVVTKAALLDDIWAGTVVGEDALSFQIQLLRHALEDDPKAPRYIETVHRVGYRFIAPVTTASSPSSIESQALSSAPEPAADVSRAAPLLVGRDAELGQLDELLAKALRGQRQVVFVTGEAGIGKTALVEAFLAQATDGCALRVGRGQCVEHYGPGEAFLPVLEALGRLCNAPAGERVVALLRQHMPSWLVQMPSLLDAKTMEVLRREVQGVTHGRMLRELAEGLDALTAEQPLVLLLEDLHWSDPSTVESLAMVARRQESARLLVLGTYRPVDLILTGHPLKTAKQELVARGQGTELSLGHLSAEAVHQYVAQRLEDESADDSLAAFVYRRTEGHPLFMAQVTEYLAQRASLTGTARAHHAGAGAIEQAVPAGLREIIEAQLGRSTRDEQHALEVASVVGAEFTAASVAAGLRTSTDAAEALCEGLARQGQFIEDRDLRTWPDGTVTGCYGFRHALYQDVLRARLGAGQRARLHLSVGRGKAAAYGESAGEIAAELALHFEQGGDVQQAVHYRKLAAERAVRRSANGEAIAHLHHALQLIELLPAGIGRARDELELRLALGVPLIATRLRQREVKQTYDRARELAAEVGETTRLPNIFMGLWVFHLCAGSVASALEIAGEYRAHAELHPSDRALLESCQITGSAHFYRGEFESALSFLEHAGRLYDRAKHHALVFEHGGADTSVAVNSLLALTLWMLGRFDSAGRASMNALSVAKQASHPFSLAVAHYFRAWFHKLCGDEGATLESASAAFHICEEYDFPYLRFLSGALRAITLAEGANAKRHIAEFRENFDAFAATGGLMHGSPLRGLLAVAYSRAGEHDAALREVDRAFSALEQREERWFEAELHRLKGELILRQSGQTSGEFQAGLSSDDHEWQAEDCFRKAVAIAREQQAKSLELRATMSLARLWQQQGKATEAHQTLAEVYGWFTEGFDTRDLREAKLLLRALARQPADQPRQIHAARLKGLNLE